jgi:uncharacterized protein
MHSELPGTAGGAPPALDDPRPAPPPRPMAPVAQRERVHEIDVVRGFALLGILLMNVEYFTRPIAGMFFGLDRSLEGLDRAAGWLVMTFVQGKFYTLFSMLFGMGFAIQAERAAARGARFGRLFLRRMLGLAAIGAVHGYLIWSGDILLVYAIVGSFLLLFFRKTRPSRLWKWAVGFVLLVVVAQLLLFVALGREGAAASREKMLSGMRGEYEVAHEVYSNGRWFDLFPQRVTEMNNQLGFLPFFGWSVLGMFLLGAWLVRNGVMAEPSAHLPLFRRFFRLGIGLGAPLAVLAMWLGGGDGMEEITLGGAIGAALMFVASFALCFGYLGGFVLLAQSPARRAKLAPVAAAGRMALTNYLLQSLVATTIFYEYGLGLFGSVPRLAQVALALVIWCGNLAFSVWWLRRFRFGPAEWLWRSITYARRQPMRRAEAPAAAA